METRLTLNSQRSACLYPPVLGLKAFGTTPSIQCILIISIPNSSFHSPQVSQHALFLPLCPFHSFYNLLSLVRVTPECMSRVILRSMCAYQLPIAPQLGQGFTSPSSISAGYWVVWSCSANQSWCELMTVALQAQQRAFHRTLSFSGFYILSALSSLLFSEPWRDWCDWLGLSTQ